MGSAQSEVRQADHTGKSMRLIRRPNPHWNGSDESMLSQCLQAAMRYRGEFESIAAAVTAPKANGKVDQCILPGNIAVAAATLQSARTNEIIPVTPHFVAASHNGVESASANLNYDGNTPYFVRSMKGLRDFGITSAAQEYGETDLEFRARYWPRGRERSDLFSDSEYLLINAIDSYFRHVLDFAGKHAFRRAGAIYLFSERLPCDHCINVIGQFLSKYRRFRLVVGFMHAHGQQLVDQLIRGLSSESSVYRYAPPPPLLPNSGQACQITFELRAQQISGPGLREPELSTGGQASVIG